MNLFDSHCHIDDRLFDNDRDEVIIRAKQENVQKLMIAGINIQRITNTLKLVQKYDNIYASVGIHPHEAKNYSEDDFLFLKNIAQKEQIIKAWGEIGLDFNRMFSPQKAQENSFIRQMEIADSLDLPLIFHERDTKGKFLDILKYYKNDKRTGVVHCFSGNRKELKAYLDLGYYIGITGILTVHKRGEELRNHISYIPSNKLLIETDAPYLVPAPQRNKTRRNEPAFLKSTFLKLAEIKNEKPDSLSKTLWNNTCSLFKINMIA